MLLLCALLFIGQINAQEINVLLDKTNDAKISFLQNYAVLVDWSHYYGPFGTDTYLQVKMTDKNHLHLWVKYKENGKEYEKDLGETYNTVHVVRGFKDSVKFEKTYKPRHAKLRKISSKNIDLALEARKTLPFFRYQAADMSDWIEFTGPLSIYVREQSKTHFYLVEKIPVENYLVHVTNCEMRVADNIEAYKAQSILARTYVVNKVLERLNKQNPKRKNWLDFQLFPDERDQAYICEMRVKNQTLPNNAVKFAVWETKDKILLDKNKKAVKIHYCAYCGDCAYCTVNGHCKTKHGLGDCQNGIAYYTNTTFKKGEKTTKEKRGLTYKEVLKKYHPNATISDYREMKDDRLETIVENIDKENEIQKSLQNMI